MVSIAYKKGDTKAQIRKMLSLSWGLLLLFFYHYAKYLYRLEASVHIYKI